MTNFDYLMQLNKLAGRTFNDLMQYPAFPFILAVYSTEELDLVSDPLFLDINSLTSPLFLYNFHVYCGIIFQKAISLK